MGAPAQAAARLAKRWVGVTITNTVVVTTTSVLLYDYTDLVVTMPAGTSDATLTLEAIITSTITSGSKSSQSAKSGTGKIGINLLCSLMSIGLVMILNVL